LIQGRRCTTALATAGTKHQLELARQAPDAETVDVTWWQQVEYLGASDHPIKVLIMVYIMQMIIIVKGAVLADLLVLAHQLYAYLYARK
jgi:hypothetical protein